MHTIRETYKTGPVMTYKDPSQQLLKAYQAILSGQIIYAGETITVGTRIPRAKTKYVYLYIESANNYSTGDKVLYNITMRMQIVSLQEISEGDETVVNSILDQILQIVGNPEVIIMTDFTCLTSQFGDSEYDTEMSDSNYIITKKLRMNHFIEQH
jgi:hypothetical protein